MKNKITLVFLLAILIVLPLFGARQVLAQSFSNSLPRLIDELVSRVSRLEENFRNIEEQIAHIELTPGPQGPQGPQGEPGQNASHGVGNIAFIFEDYLLKTDGTVWVAWAGNIPYTRVGMGYSGVTNVPIPVEDIVVWQYSRLIDVDGNYWFISLGCVQCGWQNFGPLP